MRNYLREYGHKKAIKRTHSLHNYDIGGSDERYTRNLNLHLLKSRLIEESTCFNITSTTICLLGLKPHKYTVNVRRTLRPRPKQIFLNRGFFVIGFGLKYLIGIHNFSKFLSDIFCFVLSEIAWNAEGFLFVRICKSILCSSKILNLTNCLCSLKRAK